MSPEVWERGVTMTVFGKDGGSQSLTQVPHPGPALENTGTQLWLGSSVDLCNICSKGKKSACVCKGSYAKLPTASSDWKWPKCPQRCAKRPKLLCFCPMKHRFTIKNPQLCPWDGSTVKTFATKPESLNPIAGRTESASWRCPLVLHTHALTNRCPHTYTHHRCSELPTWPGM